jgi:hypothetical protein
MLQLRVLTMITIAGAFCLHEAASAGRLSDSRRAAYFDWVAQCKALDADLANCKKVQPLNMKEIDALLADMDDEDAASERAKSIPIFPDYEMEAFKAQERYERDVERIDRQYRLRRSGVLPW